MSDRASFPRFKVEHILFLYRNYGHGGTETLILRMANWLAKSKIRTSLLLGSVDKKHIDLPGCGVITIGEDLYDRLLRPRVLRSVLAKYGLSDISHVYSFDNNSMLLSLLIVRSTVRGATAVAGCYFPWGFLYPTWSWTFSSRPQWERGPLKFIWRYLCAFAFNKCIPDRNKVFAVKAVRDNHERNFSRPLRDSRVWFVPLDFTIFKKRKRRPRKGLIVSIGRICESKSYNRYMIDVIQQLLEEGLDVEWIVYGYGENLEELRSIVAARSLTQRILFKGIISYQDIPLAVQEAYLFIGTGTTIMEAGWCGVPCIPAIESNPKPLTYGYLHEYPDLATGVELERAPDLEIGAMIKDAMKWAKEDYDRICSLTKDVALKYDCDRHMPEFLEICESADPIKFGLKAKMILAAYRMISGGWRWIRQKAETE